MKKTLQSVLTWVLYLVYVCGIAWLSVLVQKREISVWWFVLSLIPIFILAIFPIYWNRTYAKLTKIIQGVGRFAVGKSIAWDIVLRNTKTNSFYYVTWNEGEVAVNGTKVEDITHGDFVFSFGIYMTAIYWPVNDYVEMDSEEIPALGFGVANLTKGLALTRMYVNGNTLIVGDLMGISLSERQYSVENHTIDVADEKVYTAIVDGKYCVLTDRYTSSVFVDVQTI